MVTVAFGIRVLLQFAFIPLEQLLG